MSATAPPDRAVEHVLGDLAAARELAEATRLARAGRYAEAQTALGTAAPTPTGLDLRARIAAQQGRLDEAAELWREAADRLGRPGAFAAELAAVERLRSRRFGFRPWAVVAVAAAVALAGGVVASRSGDADGLQRFRDDTLAALDAQSAERRAADDALARRLDDLGDQAASAPAEAVEDRLRGVPGVEVVRGEGVLHLRLAEGAFTEGTVLSEPGVQALHGVAAALAPDAGAHVVVVAGHTDSAPLPPGTRFGDDDGLRLARARAGAQALVAGGLPADAVAVDAVGAGAARPYPDTGGRDPARNRTVTLEVYERAGAAGAGTPGSSTVASGA